MKLNISSWIYTFLCNSLTFFAQHTNEKVNLEMWREAKAYGDIQFMPFVDYYGLLSLKTVALCILGVSYDLHRAYKLGDKILLMFLHVDTDKSHPSKTHNED